MSTVLDNRERQTSKDTPVTPQYQTEDGQPNVALLEDRTPEALKASSSTALLVGVLGTLFLMLNYFPLWHTDLWGHLSYGRWIVDHQTLPVTEPLMPLSSGVPMVDTAWLSQLLGYFTFQQFGAPGLQFLYASSILFVAAGIAFSLYARTGRPVIALLAVFLFYWCDYQQLLIIRPQLAGMACFMAVFLLATSRRATNWNFWAVPIIFAFWANLHGSFVVGLATLGALTVGRAIDVFLRTRNLKLVFAESGTRRLLLMTELSAAAVLLNPYGIGIYPEVFTISGNPNLKSLIEWDPLTLRMKQGQAAAIVSLLLIMVYRLSPRRVSAAEVLLLVGLGGGALWTSRLIVWWAPIASYYFGLHASAAWKSWTKSAPREPKRAGLYSVSVLGMAWIFFAFTPFGGVILHGKKAEQQADQKNDVQHLSRTTPLEAIKYLNEHPPQGLVFNSYEWGDYLLWAGPKDVQVFVASHVHLIPSEVWQHYLEISQFGPTWKSKLDRYGVNTIVLNPTQHGGLADRLEEEKETWRLAYKTNKTVIFERISPI